MKNKPIDWKEIAEARMKELMDCRRGCQDLKASRDTVQKELENRPTKEIETIVQAKVLPGWVGMLVLCMGAAFLGFIVSINDRVAQLAEPIVEYKLVPGHTVYITKTDGKCEAVLKECRGDYKACRRKEKDREEGTTYVP